MESTTTLKLATGCGLLLALLMIATPGIAQADAVGQAGGQAAADAQGAYHADATGAMTAAEDREDQARHQAADHVRESGQVSEQAEADAYSQTKVSEPETPDCDCRAQLERVEQTGHGQFATAHQAEKYAGVDNAYVDAGADLQASGQAEAWYEELFTGVTDAFDKVRSALDVDADVDQEARAHAEQQLDTDDELRDRVADQLEAERDRPSVEPKTQGSIDAQHTAGAASGMVAEGSVP